MNSPSKYILTVVVTVFAAAPVLGQRPLREVSIKVLGVGAGSSYSSVLRTFGKPLARHRQTTSADLTCTASDTTTLTLRYTGLTIMLLGNSSGRNFEVVEIVVTSNRWQTSGIRVGASQKEVERRFGNPNSRGRTEVGLAYHYVTPGNLGDVTFEFRRGRLAMISTSETLC